MDNWSFDPFENGSAWLRADFHLHTKADKEFVYTSNTEEEKNAFTGRYIDALKKQEIRIGVVTNHNKFDCDEFKALRKRGKKEGIFILPGIELSVNDGANGIHVLVVFGNAWIGEGNDYINQFLGTTFSGKVPAQYEQENARSNDNLVETLKKLEHFNKDFFVICAHVEQKSGLLHEFDGGRLIDFGKDERFSRHTLGFQKVRTHDKRVQVKDWLKDSYPAEVEGCDAKSIEDIGRGSTHCFLKIGDFNFEAIKYALKDHKNRVMSQTKPSIRHSYIRSVRFKGGLLGDKEFGLSSGLNCLIGIRGSGKSSFLETLRYALDIPFRDKEPDDAYKKKLVPHFLASGGKIIVEAVNRQGQSYEIHRILHESPEVRIEGVPQPGLSIRETILMKPLYFGQKDLSASGEGFGQNLVEKLVGDRLRNIRENINAQRQRVLDCIELLTRLEVLKEKKKDYEIQLKDTEHRLSLYKHYGIEEKLQQQLTFDNDISVCYSTENLIRRWNQALSSVLQEFEDDLNNVTRHHSSVNNTFFTEYFEIYKRVLVGVDTIRSIISSNTEVVTDLNKHYSNLNHEKIQQKDAFAEIERELAQQLQNQGATAITTTEFKTLSTKQAQLHQMLEALSRQLERADDASKNLLVEWSALNELWLEEFRLIQNALRTINERQTALNVDVVFKGEKSAMISLVKELFRGSGFRETAFQEMASSYSDFMAVWNNLLEASLLFGSKSQAFQEAFQNNLRELLPWQVPNTYRVLYHGKPLEEHSLGQRASAMMLFILSQQDNDVLLIDQPEDDLDNQTLYTDVIRLVRQLKPNMQFIFATHNANIPVLGDAEQVFACQFEGEAMSIESGSIDKPTIQQAIVDIMEGGEEAFNKRKEIYQLWKTQNF